MALTLKSVEQPLLTQQQSAVCHGLIRVDQLMAALKIANNIIEANRGGHGWMPDPTPDQYAIITLYLNAEIRKCMMQITQLKHVAATARPTGKKVIPAVPIVPE